MTPKDLINAMKCLDCHWFEKKDLIGHQQATTKIAITNKIVETLTG
jgi:hypothetical protein